MSKEDTIFGDDWPYSKAKSTLLRSAAIVMHEMGPRSATLKNIAGKAGVTEPAIFRHFDGVNGVFESLFTVVEMYFGRFQEYYRSEEGYQGLDRMESAWARIIDTLKTNADYAYLLLQPDPVFRQYPKLREKLGELQERDRAGIMECIKEAKAKGQLQPTADAEVVAMGAVGAIVLMLHQWLNDMKGIDPVKESKRIWAGIRAVAQRPGYESAIKPTPKPVAKPASKPAAKAAPKAPAKAKPAKK